MLIECGISWKQIQAGLGFRPVDGILVSHEHQDHARAAKDAVKWGEYLYMSHGTAEALGLAEHHRVTILEPMQRISVGSFSVSSFPVEHDASDPVGFVIRSGLDRLLFLTDTSYCRFRFQAITHLMIECNFSMGVLDLNCKAGRVDPSRRKRLIDSHMSLERVVDFLKANNLSFLREIHLIHLSDENSNAEQFKDEISKLTGVPVYVAKA